jgi:hypothetical protein
VAALDILEHGEPVRGIIALGHIMPGAAALPALEQILHGPRAACWRN